jgi:tripartite-type tricarboxylate transporter receptor subunit TctC
MTRLIAAVLALSCWSAAALAQDAWPNRPLTMVVPFAAGGPVDVLGRLVGQYLGEALGKPVVIENIAGAGGMSGSQRVMQAAPDGYTFVLGSIGTHALNQTLYKRPLYNAATDFAPVALIADVPLVLITRKDLPVNGLSQFISYMKANQEKMQFGSGGTGTSSHIGCVLLNQVIGVNLTHVPYRGGGPALVDLLGGRIDYLCNILSTAVEPIKAGQVNALAMLAPERAPVLPELKTAHEQGLDNAEAYTWNAVFLPKGTPSEIVGRLNAALVKVMNNPAFQQKLDPLGLAVVAPARRSPEYLGRFVASEIDKWAGPIKASGAVGE